MLMNVQTGMIATWMQNVPTLLVVMSVRVVQDMKGTDIAVEVSLQSPVIMIIISDR